MIALVTGDIVNSEKVGTEKWMILLRNFLGKLGKSPGVWEIYRGDSFQFSCKPVEVFEKYLLLKSIIRQHKKLDIRISIGIGDIAYKAVKITESNGTAFTRSGRAFDQMKDKQYLVFSTGDAHTDEILNLFASFASLVMDNWTTAVAETVQIILEHPDWNQARVAEKLKVNQSAVSQNRKRAQLDILLEFNRYFKNCLTHLPA